MVGDSLFSNGNFEGVEKKRPRLSAIWINFGISAALLGAFFLFVDTGEMVRSFRRIGGESFLLAMFCTTTALFLGGVRWFVYLRGAGFPHKFAAAVRIRLIGQGLNIAMPGGVVGDGLQVFLISRRPRLSGAKAFATVVADRLTALVLVLGVVILSLPAIAARWPGVLWLLGAIVGGLALLAGAGLVFRMARVAPVKVWRPIAKLLQFGGVMLRTLADLAHQPRVFLSALLVSVASHSAITAAVWLIAARLGDVSYIYMIPVVSLVLITTVVPITVSGLGVREAVFFLVLGPLGFSLEDAVVISLVWFAATIIPAVSLAVIATMLSPEPGRLRDALRAARKGAGVKD